ncbi:MAG: hypothetical protein V3S32_11460 [Acidimicrobiia bacterium]
MISLTLTEHPEGVSTVDGHRIIYDVSANVAHFGAVELTGYSLVWHLGPKPDSPALLSVDLDLDLSKRWLVRCDRVDFPPGGIAYLHTHPGPGIRCQLFGRLTVTSAGKTETYGAMEPWFESGPVPVYAEASGTEPGAFVRVLILPVEWAGRRTIKYVKPEDVNKPRLQKASVFLEEEIRLA